MARIEVGDEAPVFELPGTGGRTVPPLADVDLAVARRYRVAGWATPLARLVGLPTTAGGWYIQRAILVVDGGGVVRYRNVSRTGATYQSVANLERAVATPA